MPSRIAIVSQKGGVGKTTVSLNLALALAERGWRTLLVDLDPQGGIGHALGKGDAELPGLTDVLAGQLPPTAAVRPTQEPRLSLLPRGRLDPIDVCEFELLLHERGRVDDIIAAAEVGFDLTLFDTPSGLGMPTRAALRMAGFALVPLQTERLAMRSIAQLLRVIEHVRASENPRLALLGILPTMSDRKSAVATSVLVDAWSDLTAVLETIVPRHGAFAEASEAGVPLAFLGGPPLPEARRFTRLAEEVETAMSRLGATEVLDDRPRRSLL